MKANIYKDELLTTIKLKYPLATASENKQVRALAKVHKGDINFSVNIIV